jgi:hypothetical protein
MSINKISFVSLATIIILIHLVSMQYTYTTGTNFYEKSVSNKNCNQIYDIIQNNTPDYSIYNYNYDKNWYLLVFILLIILNFKSISYTFYNEFLYKFLIIILIRALVIPLTILPKNCKCQVTTDSNGQLDLFNKTIGGGCYDKIFSGHFSFSLLLTLLLLKYNILQGSIGIMFAIITNLLHLFILTMTRSHYTIDIVMAFFVTLWVNGFNFNLV